MREGRFCRVGLLTGAVVALTIWAAGPAMADGSIEAGRKLASKCENCHGLDGVSRLPEAPNIAGQTPFYLLKQLTAFKTGERQNEMMSVVAPTLSDQDIEDLVAYYSAIEIRVVKVPGDAGATPGGQPDAAAKDKKTEADPPAVPTSVAAESVAVAPPNSARVAPPADVPPVGTRPACVGNSPGGHCATATAAVAPDLPQSRRASKRHDDHRRHARGRGRTRCHH